MIKVVRRKYFEPIQIIFHLTNFCNAQCGYCFTSSVFSNKCNVAPRWKFLVKRINNEKSIKIVSLIGGEPFLVKELPDIVKNLRDDIKINIDSNLTKIKENWNNIFRRALFSTTIDSVAEEVNAKTRGHSAFKTLDGIKFLINKGVKIQVVIVVTKHNLNTLEKTIDYLLKIGVDRVGISRVRMVGRACSFDFKYFYDNFSKIKLKTAKIVKKMIGIYGIEKILVYNLWHDKLFFDLGYKYDSSCKCSLFKACIDWNGYLYPCELMPFYWQKFKKKHKINRPNLKKITISKAFNESKLFKLFREKMLYYPIGCESCNHKKICNHGCRFYAFLTSGDLLAKDPLCNININ